MRPHPLGSVEKVVVTSEAGARMPGYVCLPATAAPPYRWMICRQGHTSGMHQSLAVSAVETSTIDVEGDRFYDSLAWPALAGVLASSA